MEAVVVPEPSPEERDALLAALAEAQSDPYRSAWRTAALRENTELDEP